jgi:hypothetical protein
VAFGFVGLFGGPERLEFLMLLVLFGATSVLFIASQGKFRGRRIFEIPLFLTTACFLQFGLVPFIHLLAVDQNSVASPLDRETLVRALLYLIVGMIAFWTGCHCFLGKRDRIEGPLLKEGSRLDFPLRQQILFFAAMAYAIGFFAKVYMLKSHLYAYVGSLDSYYSNLASAQVASFLGQFAEFALIIITIERFWAPPDRRMNFYFWSIFASECAWGLISGMKGQLLQNFLLVAVVISFVRARIAKRWLFGFVIGLVLVYPFFDEYRFLTRGPSHIEIVSASEALRAQKLALLEAADRTSGLSGWVEAGVQSTVTRLDLLASLGAILSLGSETSELQGRERLWMIPFYPFVPRFIWTSKPILDKGLRFSQVLGYGSETSTAITYPGDLYVRMGVPGIAIGMFLLGVAAQRLTNMVKHSFGKRELFLYAAIFLPCTDIEIDAFSFWAGLIKAFVTISVIAWVVYTPLRRSIRLAQRERSSPSARGIAPLRECR